MTSLMDCMDNEWLAAQASLHAAQKLPCGLKRVEALKLAGKQRWLASCKLFEASGPEIPAPVRSLARP